MYTLDNQDIPWHDAGMYVAKIPHRSSPPAILRRESYPFSGIRKQYHGGREKRIFLIVSHASGTTREEIPAVLDA